MNARLWMGFGLGRIARYQVHRVIIVEMRNGTEPQGHRKERKGFQMSRPRTCISKVLVPLELDSSTMAVIEGGSVDLRWHSKTD